MYQIVRMYRGSKGETAQRVICTGLTLQEAQEHCAKPETSSSTNPKKKVVRSDMKVLAWFDGYEKY